MLVSLKEKESKKGDKVFVYKGCYKTKVFEVSKDATGVMLDCGYYQKDEVFHNEPILVDKSEWDSVREENERLKNEIKHTKNCHAGCENSIKEMSKKWAEDMGDNGLKVEHNHIQAFETGAGFMADDLQNKLNEAKRIIKNLLLPYENAYNIIEAHEEAEKFLDAKGGK